MKTTAKVLLSCLLIGGSLSCFSQENPSKEYVNHIPAGRNILVQPLFNNEGHITGTITVDFVIDKKGNVTSAHVNHGGTSIRNKVFIHKCEAAVKAAKFNELKTAPATQHGSLSYSFKG
jgi:hypothetical protein